MSKSKKNCWETMGCGREPGGERTSWLGVCQTALAIMADGLNEGKNAGRICWTEMGSFSDGKNGACVFLARVKSCSLCKFFNKVKDEQGDEFILLQPGTEKKKVA